MIQRERTCTSNTNITDPTRTVATLENSSRVHFTLCGQCTGVYWVVVGCSVIENSAFPSQRKGRNLAHTEVSIIFYEPRLGCVLASLTCGTQLGVGLLLSSLVHSCHLCGRNPSL